MEADQVEDTVRSERIQVDWTCMLSHMLCLPRECLSLIVLGLDSWSRAEIALTCKYTYDVYRCCFPQRRKIVTSSIPRILRQCRSYNTTNRVQERGGIAVTTGGACLLINDQSLIHVGKKTYAKRTPKRDVALWFWHADVCVYYTRPLHSSRTLMEWLYWLRDEENAIQQRLLPLAIILQQRGANRDVIRVAVVACVRVSRRMIADRA
jgi:hypothetical protein